MRSAKSVDRRTVVKSLAGITLAGMTLSGATSARSETTDGDRVKSLSGDSTENADQLFDGGIGIGRGTVDRIVDGRYVVILIEEDGVTVDQRVVPESEYPDFAEGDSVIVIFIDDAVNRVIPVHD